MNAIASAAREASVCAAAGATQEQTRQAARARQARQLKSPAS